MLSDLRARSLPPLRHVLMVAHGLRALRRLPLRASLAGAGLLAAPVLLNAAPATAQQAGYGQTLGTTPMERQMYDGGGGRPSGGSILDSTNPIELMNKIRRGTAMDDATPPASAIDQALQQLEAQAAPAPAPAAPAGVSGAPGRPAGPLPQGSQPASPSAGMPVPSGSRPQNPAL